MNRLPPPPARRRPSSSWRAASAAAALLLGIGAVPAAWAELSVQKNFNPTTISPGQPSTLTIIVSNTAQAAATGVAFTDTLPDGGGGEVVVNSLTSYTCRNPDGSNAATTGSVSVANNRLIVLSGGTIPAGAGSLPSACTIVASVTSTAPGTHINTIPVGGVTSTNQGSNTQEGTATIIVNPFVAATIDKTFSAADSAVLHGGEPGSYTVTINNPNLAALTGAGFTDTLPATVVIAGAATSNTCGGSVLDGANGALGDGDTAFKLVNGTVPNPSCQITVPVRTIDTINARGVNTGDTATNTIPAGALSTAQGVSNSNSVSNTIQIETGGYLAKTFLDSANRTSPAIVNADGTETAQFILDLNNRNVTAITGAAVTDTFPAQVRVAPVPNVRINPAGCATVAATANGGSVAVSNATIPASGTGTGSSQYGKCQVVVDVVVTAGSIGTYRNTIFAGSFGAGKPNYAQVDADIAGTAPITGSKDFSPTRVLRGGTSRLTVTLANASATAATVTSFSDDLTTLGTGFVVAATPNAATTCGGSFAPTAGATTLSKTNGTIPANGSCTLSVDVLTQNTATIGTHTNTVPAANVSTSLGVAKAAFTGDLTVVDGIGGSKIFTPATVAVGNPSTLTITVNNNLAGTANNLAVGDDLTTMDAGGNVRVAASPAPSTTCGGTVTAAAGTTQITLSGGTLAANSACTITVPVVGRAGVPLSQNLTNSIAAGGITSSLGANTSAITAPLRFTAAVTVSKAFSPASAPRGGSSTLTITLGNGAGSAATLSAGFNDDLDSMDPSGGSPDTVRIAAGATTNCGASLTATPGTQLVTLAAGATIPANGSCTITVPVSVQSNATLGDRINDIPVGALVTNLGSNAAQADAALTVTSGLTLSKSFNPASIAPSLAAVTRLTINVDKIAGTPALSGIAVTDDLGTLGTGTGGAGHVIANPANASSNCGGTVSAAPGSSTVQFSGGSLGAGAASCQIQVDVQTPAGVTDTRTNTIPAGGVTTAQGISNSTAASASITRSTAPNLQRVNKNFLPDIINPGATSQLEIDFVNTVPGAQTLTNVSLTDTFPAGIVLSSNPNPSFTGSGCSNAQFVATPGAGSVRVFGATVVANSTCQLFVNVTAFTNGNRTNVIPAAAVTSDQGSTNPEQVQKSLQTFPNVTVSGFVYFDGNTNGTRDGGEDWTGGTLVYVNLVQNGAVVQSAAVNPGTGAYTFSTVASGDYTIVLSNSASGVTAAVPPGYRLTAPANGTQTLTVGTTPALDYNFGLVTGAGISGRVFRDSGPTANDGIQQSAVAEPGIAGVAVRLTDCAATVYSGATTNASGDYSLSLPGTVANGSALCVEETNAGGYVSTGANLAGTVLPSGAPTTVGGTSYTYTRSAPDRIAFTYSSAQRSYTGLNFGDVPPNDFTTDNQQTALAGTTVAYTHTYTAQSGGTVSFSTSAVANPAGPGWLETLYLDSNCNGQVDAGETQIAGAIPVAAGQKLCLVDREFVPANAPTNAQNQVTVSATFAYSGASPALPGSVLTHTDTTVVGDASGAALKLIKSVSSGSASPGSTLTYTIVYSNQSTQPLSTIVVNDATPSYTSFVSATAATPLPASLSACTKTTPAGGPVACAAVQTPGGRGALEWTFTGLLQPGASGSVSFQVLVDP